MTGVDSTGNLDMMRSIGADHVIDYPREDYTQSGQRYDRILDVAAYRSIFESKRALKPKGVYVAVPASMSRMFQVMFLGSLLSLAGGPRMGMLAWKPFKKEDVAFLTELIEAGKVKPVIDRSYPLNETAGALRYQQEGHPRGKIVITVWGQEPTT